MIHLEIYETTRKPCDTSERTFNVRTDATHVYDVIGELGSVLRRRGVRFFSIEVTPLAPGLYKGTIEPAVPGEPHL